MENVSILIIGIILGVIVGLYLLNLKKTKVQRFVNLVDSSGFIGPRSQLSDLIDSTLLKLCFKDQDAVFSPDQVYLEKTVDDYLTKFAEIVKDPEIVRKHSDYIKNKIANVLVPSELSRFNNDFIDVKYQSRLTDNPCMFAEWVNDNLVEIMNIPRGAQTILPPNYWTSL